MYYDCIESIPTKECEARIQELQEELNKRREAEKPEDWAKVVEAIKGYEGKYGEILFIIEDDWGDERSCRFTAYQEAMPGVLWMDYMGEDED